MQTIFDLDITEEEMMELFGDVVTEAEYLEDNKESARTRDVVELLVNRGEVEEARALLEKIPADERLEWYPKGPRSLSD